MTAGAVFQPSAGVKAAGKKTLLPAVGWKFLGKRLFMCFVKHLKLLGLGVSFPVNCGCAPERVQKRLPANCGGRNDGAILSCPYQKRARQRTPQTPKRLARNPRIAATTHGDLYELRPPAVGWKCSAAEWKFARSPLETEPQQAGTHFRRSLESSPQSTGNFPAVGGKRSTHIISVLNT